MDDLMWSKIESITTFDYFDINVILGFIARLNIVARWLKLDPENRCSRVLWRVSAAPIPESGRQQTRL